MSDPSDNQSPSTTALERVSRLQLERVVPSRLEAIALSNKSLTRRRWDYAVWQTGEYIRGELAISFIGSLIVGGLILLNGSATLDAVLWAILGFFALMVAATVLHYFHAPVKIDDQLRQTIVGLSLAHERDQEKLEKSKPKLEGEIQTFYTTPYREWTRSADGKAEEYKEVGVLATLRVFFVNMNPAPTTVKNFSLKVHHKEGDKVYGAHYPDEDKILRKPWEDSKSEENQDYAYNLVEFSKAREIATLGQHVEGYLRFKLYGFFLARASEEGGEGRTSMRPELTITDAWGYEHELLYKRGVPLLPSQHVIGYSKPLRL